ncbi:hypothetical protein M7I_7379 [Glarea lozoyensis 74030]|uniref:Uncharacterized protein n=1 Tax=Glarea lozoyensis (strain ATCC 74030 / MF5533) TaxID=1104152 RepID=H0EX54_GLAL7|nr:hypothetical protein M7I_7379 [Glarea lozoyensis 74030]
MCRNMALIGLRIKPMTTRSSERSQRVMVKQCIK